MPVITCPTCGTKLEIEDDLVGEQVQCGSCQQVFEAKSDFGSGRSRGGRVARDRDDDDDRPSRRTNRRREYDYDDEDDFEDDYAPRRPAADAGTGMGVTSLVLGICSAVMAVCCWPVGGVCALLAVIFGILSLKTPGKGMGIAGIIIGVLSIVLAVAVLVFSIGFNMMGRGFGPAGQPNPPPVIRGR